MKKLLSAFIAAVICISVCACGSESGKFDKNMAYENMCRYLSESFSSDDYYMQISRTKAQAQTLTEVSKAGDDCSFFIYDVTGILKYYRNNELTTVSPETFCQEEKKSAKWSDFTYEKTAECYRNALHELCEMDNSKLKEISFEKSDGTVLPYKVSAYFDLSQIDTKKLFNNGGNFGSLSVKFLCSEDGSKFDNITIHIQYDYNDEIYVIAAQYGTPHTPDENNSNGQRPDDIEEIYKYRLEELQKSYSEFLQNLQETVN